MPETTRISFEQKIAASPAQVYHALTNATLLREFTCQVATTDPKTGGRVYMTWDNGYYMAGEFTRLEEHKAISYTWQGKGDPGQTSVEIRLEEQPGGTLLQLDHLGIGSGPAWETSAAEFKKGWQHALENLVSILETGEDIRITKRPMIGILYANQDEAAFKEAGVTVKEGVLLGGVIDGLSAQKSGLQKNDLIVEIDGKALKGWDDLGPILQAHRAGDQLATVFFRGSEKHSITLTLAPRPLPAIPATVAELAAAVKKTYAAMNTQLEQVLGGITEYEASYKPGENQWCVKEVLAHLILGERYAQGFIIELLGSQERQADGFSDNEQYYIQALLVAYPTLPDMWAELKREYEIVQGIVERIPTDFPQRLKSSYWRIAYQLLQPNYHLNDHLGQMRACIVSAKFSQTQVGL
jgi:uncharacterized protein YndB with AHSA1/START domain